MNAFELGRMIKSRKLSCVEITEHYLSAAKKLQPEINAYTQIMEEYAIKKAAEVQKRLDKGEQLSPLAGVPIAVKDNVSVKGAPLTCGSKFLRDYKAVYSADLINRLENAGAILLGKLNMDEFSMGGSSTTSCFGDVHNPWDTSRITGGSSGGSAAAVASGMAAYAIGSDTGGSLRHPAAVCGVSTIRPTMGLISTRGIMAMAPSMDTAGPVARTIFQCGAVLDIMAGRPVCKIEETSGLKIGMISQYFDSSLDNEVAGAIKNAVNVLEGTGHKISKCSLEYEQYAADVYSIISCVEAASSMARLDGVAYGGSRSDFGWEVKKRILLGTYWTQPEQYEKYYAQAVGLRKMIAASIRELFKDFDLLLAPVSGAAEKISSVDKYSVKIPGGRYTAPASLAGLPAVSIPCGFTAGGLPVGMQLIAPPNHEAVLISVGEAFQRQTDFHLKTPPNYCKMEVAGNV